MMQTTASDGEVPFGNNDSEGLNRLNSDVPPNIHCDPDPPQLDICHDDLPRVLPYPPTPLYRGTDRLEIEQDFHDPVPDADPTPPSQLPLTQPNLGDHHPSLSLPVVSMDSTFMLPSTAEDRPTMAVTAQTSQAGPNSTAKRPAHVNVTERVSKKELKQVKQYLESIHPENVEKVYGMRKYTAWHGDGKSQSKTGITFQTKSMCTSGEPPTYITIVARRGMTGAYVTYESSTWSESAKAIIDEMIKAIKV